MDDNFCFVATLIEPCHYSFTGKSIKAIKTKASKIANGYFNPCDKMEVITPNDVVLNYYRINRITPNNTIVRGKWR